MALLGAGWMDFTTEVVASRLPSNVPLAPANSLAPVSGAPAVARRLIAFHVV